MNNEKPVEGTKEVDALVYRGNAVPRFIRLAWTLFIAFAIYYIFFYSDFLKDLESWISRAKG